MTDEILIIITISTIIFISPLVSKFTKIPTVPVEIILGALAVYFSLIVEHTIFELVAELGFLYLMFLAGLEVDLRRIIDSDPKILKKSLVYNAILFSLSFLITWYFGLSNIFVVTLPLISIGMLAALKKEYGEEDWVSLSILIGLVGEIVSIIVLTAVSAGLELGFRWEFAKTMMLFTAFLIVLIIIYKIFHNLLWWYPEIKRYLMPEEDHQEQDIRVSMAIFFLLITIMIYLKLEVAFGAFIAGTFIKTFFEHNKALPTKLEHFGFGWLVPIFFIHVGTSFELQSLFHDGLFAKALMIVAAMIFIRLVASFLFMKDLKRGKFLLIGLSHSMPLTLLIAVITLAYHNHSITQFYYYAFILASILEVLIVMIIIKLLNNLLFRDNIN
ncbi:sodium/hydrogen exchanger [Arcobacter nitrofigilis DSM 7299]|uniref:Sodium/hydrogen exchanger n=1 Tax=Arcobacter nitrofigilis (strain ATCC 33309 / DSM 7299 / CCUG 15893 / LMG 7604 / NCTC 12251 / CI) TaxID=572480 RepID=D5V7I7_ARCNC|nr:cation:proton antiporter [Arcobacter nitrofigilis]ADG94607.1 sodium/hydrogen exchanger [Arcobacter nitrofigilis DSM 7299]